MPFPEDQVAELKRLSWTNLLFGVGTLIGVWAIIGVLTDVAGSLQVIKGARWGGVALTFVLAQLPVVAEAWALKAAQPQAVVAMAWQSSTTRRLSTGSWH